MSDVAMFEAEAAAARDRIADAVQELGERLDPARLISEAKESVLGPVRRTGAELLDQAEELFSDRGWVVGIAAGATALVGAAIAGVAARNGGTRTQRPGIGRRVANTGSRLRAGGADAAALVRAKLDGAARTVKDTAEQTGHAVGVGWHTARRGVDNGVSKTLRAAEDDPVPFVALALGVGAGIALLVVDRDDG